jgi:hypothetical protein
MSVDVRVVILSNYQSSKFQSDVEESIKYYTVHILPLPTLAFVDLLEQKATL